MTSFRDPAPLASRAAYAAVAVAFLALPALSLRLAPDDYRGGFSRVHEEVERRNRSALGALMGELRANASDMIFVKTERYLHNGVAYAPHLDSGKMASSGKIEDRGKADAGGSEAGEPAGVAHQATAGEDDHEHEHEHEHEEHEDEHVATLIPTAENDYRGIVGWLERQVKPWRDPSKPHIHTDGEELLPWYRLMTLSDPHNVRAYMIGAWWLKAIGDDQVGEAIKFVDEGIKFNPRSYQLHLMKGYLLLRSLNDPAASREHFQKAAELAHEIRPDDPKPDSMEWTVYEEEDARGAFRMAVLTERDYGDRAEALRLAKKYLAKLKGADGPLARQVEELSRPPAPDVPPASAGPPAPEATATEPAP